MNNQWKEVRNQATVDASKEATEIAAKFEVEVEVQNGTSTRSRETQQSRLEVVKRL